MAYGEGVFIWNFSLTGAKTIGLLGISKVRKRGLQTASLCYQHPLSSRRTQAFYQTGDAWQLCGAEKIAFLAADTAAFSKAQQPIRHVIQGHKRATESYPSPLPQPQLIRNFGILSKTEGNPHTLLVPCTGAAATLENMLTVPQKVNTAII